ncbi:MAG: PAS domain-containing protein, partial [Sneathiella sp.]|nr:PAS domain-containing protein [Sneathiella sp.]
PIFLMTWGAVLWNGVLGWFVGSQLFALMIVSFILFVLRARKITIRNVTLMLENTQALQDRLEAEEQLRHTESDAAVAEQKRQSEAVEMQRNLINAIAFPMVLSHGNEALEVTPAARLQFKVQDKQLEKFSISDFFVNPQDQAKMGELLDTQGRLDNFEVLMHDTDGNQFWTVAAMRPLKYDGRDCWLNSIYIIDARKRMEQDLAAAKDAAEATLAELKTTQDSLIHSEKMASLGQLTAGIAHEIKNPLNFVNNFSKLSAEMLDELTEILQTPIATLEQDDKEDAEDLLRTVSSNLLKIEEHGKRADSIVKNMLLHSRRGPGEKQKVNLNSLAEEAMNLAYHGARASDSSFNVEMKTDFSDAIAPVVCHPQDLQRVFLNICSNGMYAAVKRSKLGGDPPWLSICTRMENSKVIIEVTDNGGGVPDDIKDKIFQPFFTTKPTGEGTGLGLSMSYDILQQHGGTLSIKSGARLGSTFRVEMPAGSPAEVSL